MLFITDSAGVPSVAKLVQVAKGPAPLMSAVKNRGAGRCVDLPNSTLTIRTYIQSHTCNNAKPQTLTRLPSDKTLRVLGNCLDVPSRNFISGQRIWTYTCNGTSAQTWQFGTDGTIRPVARTTLCLSAVSTVENAAIGLAHVTAVLCRSGPGRSAGSPAVRSRTMLSRNQRRTRRPTERDATVLSRASTSATPCSGRRAHAPS